MFIGHKAFWVSCKGIEIRIYLFNTKLKNMMLLEVD